MKRSVFFKTGVGAALGLSVLPSYSLNINETDPGPLKTSIVKEFVVAGHKDLEKVKAMLNDQPNLVYSRYDWGNGDFEEAIEGAGHLGNKEIANYLIGQGARVNLFVLTMLGKTEIVKSMLRAYPNLLYGLGAHGLTLLHHAKVGGRESQDLLEFLTEMGLEESHFKIK